MEASVASVLSTGRRPASVLATDGTYLAFASTDSPSVSVLCLTALDAAPLTLESELQTRAATALAIGRARLGSSDPISGGGEGTVLLVVASRECVVGWEVEEAYGSAADGLPLGLPHELLRGQGTVEALAIQPGGEQVAIAAGEVVLVVELLTREVAFRLEGHREVVGALAYCSHDPSLLVSAADDRTFKLWDLRGGALLYQSTILSAAPLTALAMDPSFPRLSVGGADGTVRFFDISAAPAVRSLQVLDVGRMVERVVENAAAVAAEAASRQARGVRVISSQPAWRTALAAGMATDAAAQSSGQTATSAEQLDAIMSVCSTSGCVQSLHYCDATTGLNDGETGLLAEAPRLLVGTPRGLVSIDSHTYDLQAVFLAQSSPEVELPLEAQTGGGPKVSLLSGLSACSAFAFTTLRSGQLSCIATDAFNAQAAIVELSPVAPKGVLEVADLTGRSPSGWADGATGLAGEGEGEREGGQEDEGVAVALSIFPSAPLPDTSMLKVREREGATSSSVKSLPSKGLRMTGFSTSRGRAGLSNQPVTFHTKVKSSGYGGLQPAVRIGQRPGEKKIGPNLRLTSARCIGRGPKKTASGKKKVDGGGGGLAAAVSKQYPPDCGPLVHLQERHCLSNGSPLHIGPIFRLAFSPDGTRLATASADKTARVIRLPLHRHQGDGTDLIGHNAGVTSVTWSQDGNMLLTASADRSARLWNASRPDPLLNITHVRKPLPKNKAPSDGGRGKENPAFNSEVRAARFLGLDQFVVLACQNKLHVYNYKQQCEDPQDDIARLRSSHSYKLLGSLQASSQNLLDLACANTFVSHMVLAVGSNRSIEVFDLAAGRSARTIEDAHSRPAHSIVLNAPSNYVNHPQEAYELFATASQDGDVRLWDLRAARCVRKFTGHSARQQTCGMAFSPCLRYMAVGSEDKTVYQYDLRTGLIQHKMRNHSDVVSDVAYHPLHPQLATSCYDGRIRFFSDGSGS